MSEDKTLSRQVNWRKRRRRSRNGDFLLCAARIETGLLWRCYTFILLEISRTTRWWCLKCVIVYLARDIRPFVMYCVNGKPRLSLLIEYIDSMIESVDSISRDERGFPLTQYITNSGISRARYTITHFKHHHRVLRLNSNRMRV